MTTALYIYFYFSRQVFSVSALELTMQTNLAKLRDPPISASGVLGLKAKNSRKLAPLH